MAITKRLLSGSTNGKAIIIASTTAASGTLVHTAVTGTSNIDEVFVYAQNLATTASIVRANWGALTSGDRITMTLQPQDGPYLIAPGFPLQNGLAIRVNATGANRVAVHGYVHRI